MFLLLGMRILEMVADFKDGSSDHYVYGVARLVIGRGRVMIGERGATVSNFCNSMG